MMLEYTIRLVGGKEVGGKEDETAIRSDPTKANMRRCCGSRGIAFDAEAVFG
jgi:hypothetical protein